VREVKDSKTLKVGDIAVTAHFTPGHTPGSTTWTWRSCEGSSCVNVVYADSLNAVSLGDYRFSPIAATFRRSMETVAQLPCDLIVSVHPGFTEILEKHAKDARGATGATGANPFIDSAGCRNYAAAAGRAFEKRLEKERGAAR
jgi:metallo-beta-lactamase class B